MFWAGSVCHNVKKFLANLITRLGDEFFLQIFFLSKSLPHRFFIANF